MPDIVVGTNSYVDLATADAHFDARLHADAWTGADADTQARALIMACVLLDRSILWKGVKADAAQALEWPRVGIAWAPPGEVPPGVKLAQMELALLLIGRDTTAPSDLAGMKSVQADTLKIEVDASDRVKTIPDAVYDYVRAYGSRSGGLSTIRLVR